MRVVKEGRDMVTHRQLEQVRTRDARVDKVLRALWANRVGATYVATAAEVVPVVESLLVDGEQIGCGGSVSLAESGVMDLLSSGRYDFLDRSKAANTEEKDAILRACFSCDTFLGSANALTEQGEIYLVDMNANRVAAMIFGPRQVVLVVGMNKVVATLDDAVRRVKEIAAPRNMARLGLGAPCEDTGTCVSVERGGACAAGMALGCAAPGRICCNYVVMGRQAPAHDQRVKVILVGEDLGY